MKVIKHVAEMVLMAEPFFLMQHIENTARTCYRSFDKQGPGTFDKFIRMLVSKGHEAMLEHAGATINLRIDRAIANELVRHRIASYAQESTRYVNYSKDKDIEFILPLQYYDVENSEDENLKSRYARWRKSCKQAETAYNKMIEEGASAQEARNVLPLSTATTISITANMREWRNIFKLRCAKDAHPQMRRIMLIILRAFSNLFPCLFEDLYLLHKDEIDALTEEHIMYLVPAPAQSAENEGNSEQA